MAEPIEIRDLFNRTVNVNVTNEALKVQLLKGTKPTSQPEHTVMDDKKKEQTLEEIRKDLEKLLGQGLADEVEDLNKTMADVAKAYSRSNEARRNKRQERSMDASLRRTMKTMAACCDPTKGLKGTTSINKLVSLSTEANRHLRKLVARMGSGGGGTRPPTTTAANNAGGGGGDDIDVPGSEDNLKRIEKSLATVPFDITIRFAEAVQRIAGELRAFTEQLTGFDPVNKLFGNLLKDATTFKTELNQALFITQGISQETRTLQQQYENMADSQADITGQEKVTFQKAQNKFIKAGMKDQEKIEKILKRSLSTAKAIGANAEETAEMFSHWNQQLGLGDHALDDIGRGMVQTSRQTGLMGENLTRAVKSAEVLVKSFKDAGTLTAQSAKNIIALTANAQKLGVEGPIGELVKGLASGYDFMTNMNDGMKNFLILMASSSNKAGIVGELVEGRLGKSKSSLKALAEGLEKFLRDTFNIGLDQIDTLNDAQRDAVDRVVAGLSGGQVRVGMLGRIAETLREAGATAADNLKKIDSELNALAKAGNDTIIQEKRKVLMAQKEQTILDENLSIQSKLFEALQKIKKAEPQLAGPEALKKAMDTLRSQGDFVDDVKTIFGDMDLNNPGGLMIKAYEESVKTLTKDLEKSGTDGAKKKAKELSGSLDGFRKAITDGNIPALEAYQKQLSEAQQAARTQNQRKTDPISDVNQTLIELNNRLRDITDNALFALIDKLGVTGLTILSFGASLTVVTGWLFRFQATIGSLIRGFATSRFVPAVGGGGAAGGAAALSGGAKMLGYVGKIAKFLGPIAAVLGVISGALEGMGNGRGMVEGGILGLLTGSASTGSFLSDILGIDKGSIADEMMGVFGAAGQSALTGGAIGSLFGPAGTVVGAILGAIAGAIAELYKIATTDGAALGEALKGMWENIKVGWEGFMTNVKPLVDSFMRFIDMVAVDIGEMLGTGGQDLKSVLESIPWADIFKKIGEFLKEALPILGQIGRVLGEVVIANLILWWDMMKGAFNFWKGLFKVIYGGLETIVGLIGGIFSGDFTTFENGLKRMISGLGDMVLGLFQFWVESISDMLSHFLNALGFEEAAAWMDKNSKNITDGIKWIFGALEGLVTTVGQLGKVMSAEGITGAIGAIYKFLTDLPGSILRIFTASMGGQVAWLKDQLESVISAIIGVLPNVKVGPFSLNFQDAVRGAMPDDFGSGRHQKNFEAQQKKATIPAKAIGTNKVLESGLALVHKGEAIVPADALGYKDTGSFEPVMPMDTESRLRQQRSRSANNEVPVKSEELENIDENTEKSSKTLEQVAKLLGDIKKLLSPRRKRGGSSADSGQDVDDQVLFDEILNTEWPNARYGRIVGLEFGLTDFS